MDAMLHATPAYAWITTESNTRLDQIEAGRRWLLLNLMVMRVNPDDGRSKQVWITQDGRDFQVAAVGLLKADAARLIPKLDIDQFAELTAAPAGIRKVLDDDRSVAQSHAGPETKTP